jgi:hypothetical protein
VPYSGPARIIFRVGLIVQITKYSGDLSAITLQDSV